MASQSECKIKVLDKTFKIIDLLEQENAPLGVNDIARKTSLNAATAFRILKSLAEYGWVYQDSNEKYIAGYRLCSAFRMGNFYHILKDASFCVMKRISDNEDEVLNLCIRKNDACMLLQQSRSSKFADYVMQVDSSLPLYATACGKILISELSKQLFNDLMEIIKFKPYTDHTICSPKELEAELEKIRSCGYAVDREETMRNANCIAVAVRDNSNNIVAALSLSGVIGSLSAEKEKYYAELLQKAADEISKKVFG